MPAADRERVVDYLAEQEEALVELLRRLTLAESPSHDAPSQEAVKDILVAELGTVGFAVRSIPGRRSGGSIFARPRERKKHSKLQLLLGHFDTVWPAGTLERMPFEVVGNLIKGPGVFDMKGGVVQIILALRALRELNLAAPLTPQVFLNSDEEIGSSESQIHIRRLARRVERAYVLEPALGIDGAIKTARKGVGRFVVRVKGKAAHAGLDPGSGASAILELSHVIQKLHRLNDPQRGISVNVGTVDGGIRPNVIAPESKAVADVRVATREDAKAVEKAIYAIEPQIPGVELSIEGGIGRPPLEPTPANERLWEAAREIASDLGFELKQALAGGGSDGSTTSQYTATLEGVGDWEAVGEDGKMAALTGAGLIGKATSVSPMIPRLMDLEYEGHVLVAGKRRRMRDYVVPVEETAFDVPVVLMVGTSMSAGKTTAGRVIIHELNSRGWHVVGAKFTGAARYRDTLSYGDAGAEAILDFVDAGLPSTVVPKARFREAMKYMLSRIAAENPEAVVAEAGASPLEPYNGDICIEALREQIAFVVLCAWGPYSIVGVQKAFGLQPHIVTGPTTNTTVGIRLAEKLTGIPALNLMDPESLPRLSELLDAALR